MSGSWDKSRKAVTAHPPNRHATSAARVGHFVPPGSSPLLNVDRVSLIAAMARTALMSGASPELMRAQVLAAAASVDCCVDEGSLGLVLSTDLALLNGSERSAFAGRVGAGLCDLYMQSLHYVWRDQADRLIRTRQPLADFLYEGGSAAGLGVAIAEAKGTTQRRTQARTQAHVDAAYLRQVDRYVGAPTAAGAVLHGYAVALCATLGKPAYLCVAETDVPPLGAGPGGSGTELDGRVHSGRVSMSTALGNYATVLWLAGFRELSMQLRLLRVRHASPSVVARTLTRVSKRHDSRGLVSGPDLALNSLGTIGFAVHHESLHALAEQLRTVRDRLGVGAKIELPILESEPEVSPNESFVQFPDGLAAFHLKGKRSISQAMSQSPLLAETAQMQERKIEGALVVAEPLSPDRSDAQIEGVQYLSSS